MKTLLSLLAITLLLTSCDPATTGDVAANPDLDGWCQVEDTDFSFFVTSMAAFWALSGDDINDWTGGFGGDFGGIEGADGLCQTIAAATGKGDKTWRAFLSATDDGNGNPIHAIERIGEGPWYDANGRLVATGISGLLSGDRPDGDEQATSDMVDECGAPLSILGDAHDTITGSDEDGRLWSTDPDSTCNDWTSSDPNVGNANGGDGQPGTLNGVRCGHTFPRQGGPGGGPGGGEDGKHWMSDHGLLGCGKGANLEQGFDGHAVGTTGGYGQLYCFAL